MERLSFSHSLLVIALYQIVLTRMCLNVLSHVIFLLDTQLETTRKVEIPSQESLTRGTGILKSTKQPGCQT